MNIKNELKICLVQLTSKLSPKNNLDKIRTLIEKPVQNGAQAVFLPECFYSLSKPGKPTPYLVERDNKHFDAISNLAKEFGIYLIGGSAATKVSDKIFNRAYNFDPQGNLINFYDKNNLFAVNLKKSTGNELIINESDVYTPSKVQQTLELGDFRFGMSICFDLRFPELYRDYTKINKTNCLVVSSAFTVPTGKAHWHTLLKARAIENQSYVIASAQYGQNNDVVSTFGHSVVYDPWGELLIDLEEGEKACSLTLKLDRIEKVRSRMKVF